MKTIKVKPIETLSIELTDKTYICYFNMIAIANMQERLSNLHMRMGDISPARMVSMILWAGINAGTDVRISEEEATALAVSLSPMAYGQIMDMYFKSITDELDEESKEVLKKEIARQISTAMK